MTATLQLVQLSYHQSLLNAVDMIDYGGVNLAYGGWSQAITSAGENVIETIPLRIQGTSHDNLASKVQAIDEKIRQAAEHFDMGCEFDSVWLRAKTCDETGTRQALVRRAKSNAATSLMFPPAEPGNMMRSYNLALERFPWWESTSYEVLTGQQLNATGGAGAYTDLASVMGDVSARVSYLDIRGDTSNILTELWLGFRSSRFGVPANLQTVWECEDGDCSSGGGHYDTSVTGTYLTTTFATQTTMQPRVTTEIRDVTGYTSDQRGEFIVLARARVGSTTTSYIRLLDGMINTDGWRTQDRVKVTATDWKLYALGTVKIPPERMQSYATYALRIEAQQYAGSGNLYLDNLILIPCGEGALYLNGAQMSSVRRTRMHVLGDGQIVSYSYQGSVVYKTPAVAPMHWSVPLGAGYIVAAAQRADAHVTTDSVYLIIQIYPRWRTLRGSE